MAYRDEEEALRARVAAMEDRVRQLEEEIEAIRRRPAPLAPTVRVPVVDGEARSTAGGLVRLFGTVVGALWFGGWLVYYVAALFGVHDAGELIRLTTASSIIGFLPGGVTFYFSMRAPRVFYREEHVVGVRVAPPIRVASAEEDEAEVVAPSTRAARRA